MLRTDDEKRKDYLAEKKYSWRNEQMRLAQHVKLCNTEEWQNDENFEGLRLVAGVDVSFIKGDDVNAVIGLVVLQFPSLEVVYEDCQLVKLEEPYIPSYLAFREVPPILDVMGKLYYTKPQYIPQLIVVDGNGLLHPREFGLACHLGCYLWTPTIGAAKKLFVMEGIQRDEKHKESIRTLSSAGDKFFLFNKRNKCLGAALKPTNDSQIPIYVSPGHCIDIETACRVITRLAKYRIPEPTRQADLRSRKMIEKLFPNGFIKGADDEYEFGDDPYQGLLH